MRSYINEILPLRHYPQFMHAFHAMHAACLCELRSELSGCTFANTHRAHVASLLSWVRALVFRRVQCGVLVCVRVCARVYAGDVRDDCAVLIGDEWGTVLCAACVSPDMGCVAGTDTASELICW